MLARPCPKPEPQMWDLGPELRDKWEIPRSQIQLIKKLGQGNFGEVYYGKWSNNIEVSVWSFVIVANSINSLSSSLIHNELFPCGIVFIQLY